MRRQLSDTDSIRVKLSTYRTRAPSSAGDPGERDGDAGTRRDEHARPETPDDLHGEAEVPEEVGHTSVRRAESVDDLLAGEQRPHVGLVEADPDAMELLPYGRECDELHEMTSGRADEKDVRWGAASVECAHAGSHAE